MAEAEQLRLTRADIEEARAEIQKAIGLLVTRFGRTSDLWAHLQLALDRLQEPAKPRETIEAVAVPDPEPEPEVTATVEPEESEVAPPLEEPPVVAEAVTRKGARKGWRDRR